MKRNVLQFLTFVFCAVLAFSSCSKSPENIGVDFQSEDDYVNLQFTDTVELICHSTIADSIGTTNVAPLLGSIMDPVFGLTNAGFCTQLHISSTTPNFKSDSTIIDSVVLLLSLTNYYGDTTTIQTINIYELSDSLSSTETYHYYSNTVANHKVTDLSEAYQLTPRPKTKDTLGAAIMRIPLSHEFDTILRKLNSNSTNDELRKLFYGFYVTATPVASNGCIVSIDLTDNNSTVLRVYYHDIETPNKSVTYDFYVVKGTDTYFNTFTHDYTLGSPDFLQQVIDGDTALGRQTIYVQPMGGVKTFVKMPNIDKWKKNDGEHIVINEARLVIKGTATDTAVYKAPLALALMMIDDDGSIVTLPDISEGSSYYSGTYNSDNNTVMFRISEYVQNIVSGKKQNKGLWLSVSGASYVPNRWIMAGSDDETNGIHLEVKYSTLGE